MAKARWSRTEPASTTIESNVPGNVASMLADVLGGDLADEVRRARGGEDVQAGVVAGREGPQQLGLDERLRVADDVGDGLPRRQVEVRRDLAELEVEVDDDRGIRLAERLDHRQVDRDRRRTDPALGGEHDDDASACRRPPVRRTRRRRPRLRALEPDEHCLDERLELAVVEGLGHDVVGADLEQPDALLDLVALGDAHDRDRDEGRGRPDLAAQLVDGPLAADRIDDDELVIRDGPERLVGVGEDGDAVTDAR